MPKANAARALWPSSHATRSDVGVSSRYSFLVPLSAVAARAIVTVEGVASRGGALHPVQQSMVDLGGSQCGYCTPGFVMTSFVSTIARDGLTIRSASPAIYVAAPGTVRSPTWRGHCRIRTRTTVGSTCSPRPILGAGGAQRNPRFARPTSLEGLFQAFADYPGARVIAGGTDLMVSANRRQERWPALIAVDAVAELQQFTWKDDEIVLGAGLSLASIDQLVGRDHRGELALLEEVFPLFSSRLIRHRATLGGNLANASPVGDASPALLALGASLMLSSLRGERQVALGDFFAGYRRTVLEPGEIIVAIRVPRPLPRWQRFYKVSKRVQDDISTVAAGFALESTGTGSRGCASCTGESRRRRFAQWPSSGALSAAAGMSRRCATW